MGDTKLGYELYEFLSRKIISGILVHFGDDQEEAAKSIANAVCDELIHEWGGAFCYIPKAVLAKLSPRNEQIFAEFNGANYGALRWSRSFGQPPGWNKLRPVPGFWF